MSHPRRPSLAALQSGAVGMWQSKKGRSESSLGSLQRFTDLRKEAPSRAKHLRAALTGLSAYERRGLLEQCSVEAFQLFHELLGSGRSTPETLELALFTLEQLLLHLPDLVGQKWQFHGIGAALRRLLSPHNDPLLRRRALKLFIFWYQILGVSKHGPDLPELDALFASLVPHFPRADGQSSEKILEALCDAPVVDSPIQPARHAPLLPVADKAATQSQALQEFLESLLKGLSYVSSVEWPHKKQFYQLKSFRFLLDKFAAFYLPIVFPALGDGAVDLSGDGPGLPATTPPKSASPMNDPLVICKYCVVRWVNLYTMSHKAADATLTPANTSLLSEGESPRGPNGAAAKLPTAYALIRGVLFENMQRTSVTLSILREGLLLPLPLDRVILRILRTLKEWLFAEVPPPWEEAEGAAEKLRGDAAVGVLVQTLCWWYWNPYLGDDWTKNAGATLQLNAKILAMLKDLASPQRPPPIQLSVDTWVVLLESLAAVVAASVPPERDLRTPFPAAVATSLFQTLLITWVLGAAVCRVPLPPSLWDRLQALLVTRTAWPQLVEEWAKVMESSTRALGSSLYGVDLLNAPLEKPRSHEEVKSGKKTLREIRARAAAAAADTPVASPRLAASDDIDFCEPILPELLDKRGSLIPVAGAREHPPASSSPSSGVDSDPKGGGDWAKSTASPSERSGSDADASLDSANPESLSLGGETSSLHSADFGALAASERDGEELVAGDLTEGEDETTQDEEEVELTPRMPDGDDDSGPLWALVWRRVFGSLGDLAAIPPSPSGAPPDADARLKAVQAVGRLADMLIRISENQGMGRAETPTTSAPDAQLVPPYSLLAPLLLNVAASKEPSRSREEAVKLLCRLVVRRNSRPPLDDKVRAQFYHCLHEALEAGVAGAAEEVVSHVSKHVLGGAHLLLLPDCLSASEQVINSELSGDMLSNAAGFLAAVAGLPPAFPLPEGSAKVRERAARLLLKILGFSEARRTPAALSAAVNGLALLLLNLQRHEGSSSAQDQLIHDTLGGLGSALLSKDPGKGLRVVEALAPLLERDWEPWTQSILETFIERLDSRRSSESDSSLSQRLVEALADWLVLPGGSEHLRRAALWVLASCTEENSCGGVLCAARAALFSLSRALPSYPLPQFRLAQGGSLESEPGPATAFSAGPRSIWSLVARPEERKDLLFLRNQGGKAVWELDARGPPEPRLEADASVWLRQAAERLEREAPAPTEEEEPSPLAELLTQIRLTSPECGREEALGRDGSFPGEPEIRAALHSLCLQTTLKTQPPQAPPRPIDGGGDWRRLVRDLAFQDAEFVTRLAPLGSEAAQVGRQLRHLDAQFTRSVHKVAVFYVGPGQQDKTSILSNESGSAAFESFVGGLGWEVDLSTHSGYAGGLNPPGSTAYFASRSSEVLFHVSTRLPSADLTKKLRHLGNDEVHVVWCEDGREYRKSVIATDFGDVLIVIYPLADDLFRLSVQTSKACPRPGPLLDGAMVSGLLLASAVRWTAVNAGEGLRRQREGWVPHALQRELTLSQLGGAGPSPDLAPLLRPLLRQPTPPLPASPPAHPTIAALVSHSSSPVNV